MFQPKETAFCYDRVYPIYLRVCSPFFAPSGSPIRRGNDYHRWRWFAAAGNRPALESATPPGGVFSGWAQSTSAGAHGGTVSVPADLRLGLGLRGSERSRTTP